MSTICPYLIGMTKTREQALWLLDGSMQRVQATPAKTSLKDTRILLQVPPLPSNGRGGDATLTLKSRAPQNISLYLQSISFFNPKR